MQIFLSLLILLSLFSCVPKQEDIGKSQWQYFYDLGMSSYIAKNYSEAIANFFKASRLAPTEPKVWNALGLAYMEVQEYQKAENAFLRSLQVDKTYTEAKLNLGVLYYRQRNYEKALKVLKEVIADEAFPQKHLAFYHLAKVYQAMDRRGEYLVNLRKAVVYNPMFLDAQLELAQFYEAEGDYTSAKEIYQHLINNGIASPFIHFNMAKAEYKLGNYHMAKDYIKRVIEDKQSPSKLRSDAYELLSLILIAEQRRQHTQMVQDTKKEASEPKLSKPVMPAPSQPTKPSEPVGETDSKADTLPKTAGTQETEALQKAEKFYRIQLGAFSSVNNAKALKERLENELRLKDVVIAEGMGIFRVFYGRFKSREEALRELYRLKNHNFYGFIVHE